MQDTMSTLARPLARQIKPWYDYGKPRLWFVGLMILAAGVDVRTRDIGIGGPASNPLEVLMLVAFAVLVADAVIYSRQPARIIESAWHTNRFVVLYFGWAFVAGFVGIYQLSPLSFFVFRNLLPAFVAYAFLTFSVRNSGDLLLCVPVRNAADD